MDNTTRFLIVDDQKFNVFHLETILKKAGYKHVTGVYSGYEALGMLGIADGKQTNDDREEPFDIILTDLTMPGMDGIEFCKQVRRHRNFDNIPIIMITASNEIRDLEMAYNSGVIDFIQKPFINAEIIARIQSALKIRTAINERLCQEHKLNMLFKKQDEDLKIARNLQRSLLPLPMIDENIIIKGAYLPEMYLGGDLYYWCHIDENRYGVILIDVMGHGTATSLICMYLRSLLPGIIRKAQQAELVIAEINKHLNEFNHASNNEIAYYCTAIYAIINTTDNSIEYINAGHPAGLLILKDGKISNLDEGCPPLGLGLVYSYKSKKVYYQPPRILYLFTDGLSETFKTNNIDLLEEINKVTKIELEHKADTIPIDLIEEMISKLRREDDISIILIKLLDKRQRYDIIRLDMLPDIQEISRVDMEIENFLRNTGFEKYQDVCFAAHELIINSVQATKQRYEDSSKYSIKIEVRASKDMAELNITDHAGGLPDGLPAPFDGQELDDLLEESGRGLSLIRLLMDSFEYSINPDRTAVYTIRKRGYDS